MSAPAVPLISVVGLALALFGLGALAVVLKRSLLSVFMGIEVMLNSANLVFVAAALAHGSERGHAVAFFVMAVAAAEAVVGLSLFVAFFRHDESLDTADLAKDGPEGGATQGDEP